MNVLIVGSGGREHALAWKIAQSPRSPRLWIAPGNGGTAALGENVPIHAEDVEALVEFARQQAIDLVVVGPEAALAVGLVDALQQAGIRAFGPTRAAAEIETSKAFAKAFMQRQHIPTARFATFQKMDDALVYLEQVDHPVVIKTSGLAAGKGVLLPETLAEARQALETIFIERAFGSAGNEVIIEERLQGEEVSLLAFSDGVHVQPMPPAQDHKRLLDGDQGPNTGGMGAYAPAQVCPPELVEQITRSVLQPAVDGLRAEGRPFIGVLYAGLMLAQHGPQVLEFNCRFGDPETQVLLPLLEDDLLEIIEACLDERLGQIHPRWRAGAAACVVLASEGYPGQYPVGLPINGLTQPGLANSAQALVFHAGTRLEQGQALTAGGRVLNITGQAPTLQLALDQAYETIQKIGFAGMQYRRDIGHRALTRASAGSAYAAAGVNIDAGNRAVSLMKEAVRSTYTPVVLAGIGAFGGLFDGKALVATRNPVLVASTDGVGTKVRFASAAGRYDSIGQDIVNHCINDILVQGAHPLFFLDYFATAHLQPEIVANIVSGIAAACRASECVLLGGETAEMPGVYGSGEFDLAGTIVGYVQKDKILPRGDLQPGDLLVGLASSGPHTNGYSLIRAVFADTPLDTYLPELGCSLADALLVPHRSYLPVLENVLALEDSPVKALAHLTGGGFIENIPRVLPDGLQAIIHRGSWQVPALFRLIQSKGHLPDEEMYRVFNMGIGMLAVIAPADLARFQEHVNEPVAVIGELATGEKGTLLR